MTYLTSDMIEEGKSENGGWSEAQLAILKVDCPPVHGWKARAIGMEIDCADLDKFLAIKDARLQAR